MMTSVSNGSRKQEKTSGIDAHERFNSLFPIGSFAGLFCSIPFSQSKAPCITGRFRGMCVSSSRGT